MTNEKLVEWIEITKSADTFVTAIFFLSQLIFPLKNPDQYMLLYLMNVAIIILYMVIDITYRCKVCKLRNSAMIDLLIVHILILIMTFGTMFNVNL